MKIAQVAPLSESCPPQLYGGTERVVAYLTDELVRSGHEVTLFASGDSKTLAQLDAARDRALRLEPGWHDAHACHVVLFANVLRRFHEFDIVHFHHDYVHFPAFSRFADRTLTTQHGRLDLPDLPAVYRAFPQMSVVSISEAQRKPLPHAHWLSTVHHGLPRNLHKRGEGRDGYLAFLGRICPEKGIERAIAIARTTGTPLKIAAKIDDVDRAYYESSVRHLIDGELIEYIGEITESQKTAFLGNALAVLFPIDWPEPFGLVIIEAMACGTPVIAWRNGSVAELVEDGVTGFVVDSVDAANAAVARAGTLDRAVIRHRFEARFTADRMAARYVDLYRTMGEAADRAAARSLRAGVAEFA